MLRLSSWKVNIDYGKRFMIAQGICLFLYSSQTRTSRQELHKSYEFIHSRCNPTELPLANHLACGFAVQVQESGSPFMARKTIAILFVLVNYENLITVPFSRNALAYDWSQSQCAHTPFPHQVSSQASFVAPPLHRESFSTFAQGP